jgi:5-methylcytosine-specific restriction protein A
MAQWPYSTAAWQRLRRVKLNETPGCETCKRRGRLAWAEVVDHIVPINAGGEPFPGLDGLRSLCASCHNIKTNHEQLGEQPLMKGCDVNGLPLDAGHEFYGVTPSHHEQLERQERRPTRKTTKFNKRARPWG